MNLVQTCMETNETYGFLDPFELLGVSTSCTPHQVRKAYMSLSLVAHPDKGGSAAQMAVVHNAYKFVSEQIGISAERSGRTVEELSEEFRRYCEVHNDFREFASQYRSDATPEFTSRFNDMFDRMKGEGDARVMRACIDGGYGEFMVDDEVADVPALTRDVVPYVEPQPIVKCSPRDMTLSRSLDDYSTHRLCDYRSAYNATPETLPIASYVEADSRPLESLDDIQARRNTFLERLFASLPQPIRFTENVETQDE